ncbi:hypothetical protein Tco_1205858 [Tanacetum coccineum]
MIDVRADVELKKTLVVAIQKLEGDGYILNTIRIEYERNHLGVEGMKKNAQMTRQETTSSNPFDALTMVENDDELGKNKESDVIDEESKSEVEDVYDETTSFMTFKSRGETEKKSLYECWKDDYDQGRL